MRDGFIFGGATGLGYDELQRRRAFAESLLASGMQSRPKTAIDGINSAAQSILGALLSKRYDQQDAANRTKAEADLAGLFSVPQGPSFGQPIAPQGQPMDPNNPQGIATDAMRAIGKTQQIDLTNAPEHMKVAGKALGLNEAQQGAAIQDYLATGGANLDPATTAWCAAFVNSALKQSGMEGTGSNMARSFLNWGVGVDSPQRGDIAVFRRGDPNGPYGHVGFYDGQNPDGTIRILGGNQGDAVSVAGYSPNDLLGYRRAATSGGFDIGRASAMMDNPYIGDAQKNLLGTLIQQQLAPPDPMKALELERAQLELEALRNPQAKPKYETLSADEVMRLGLPPGVYERAPDGNIETVASTPIQANPIADLAARAEAAGLVPGSPEYQQFMLSGGKAEGGMVIESDGQGGFRMVQGSGAGVAASKPFTEAQSKDITFSTRAKGALTALDPIAGALTDRSDVAAGWLPMGIGGGMQSEQYQVAKTAGDEFLQAILRKDTGAAITPDEQTLYGDTYLPRPGDNDARLAYKAEARQRAVAALEAGMSPAQIIAQERALQRGDNAQPAPSGNNVLTYNPATGEFE